MAQEDITLISLFGFTVLFLILLGAGVFG